jgi:BMFP domain-containing protein YqiC
VHDPKGRRSRKGRPNAGEKADFRRCRGGGRRRILIVVDPKMIDDLARRLAASMPASLRALQSDLEQNFKAALQAGLGRLDLVTREEFEVQSAVLRRTREKLQMLEKRVAELERRAGPEMDPAAD